MREPPDNQLFELKNENSSVKLLKTYTKSYGGIYYVRNSTEYVLLTKQKLGINKPQLAPSLILHIISVI